MSFAEEGDVAQEGAAGGGEAHAHVAHGCFGEAPGSVGVARHGLEGGAVGGDFKGGGAFGVELRAAKGEAELEVERPCGGGVVRGGTPKGGGVTVVGLGGVGGVGGGPAGTIGGEIRGGQWLLGGDVAAGVGAVGRLTAHAGHEIGVRVGAGALLGHDAQLGGGQSFGRRHEPGFAREVGAEDDGGLSLDEVDVGAGHEGDGAARWEFAGAFGDGEGHGADVIHRGALCVGEAEGQKRVVRAVAGGEDGFLGLEAERLGLGLSRPFGRGEAAQGVAIPEPRALGQAEVIDNAHPRAAFPNAAVVKAAPDGRPGAPRGAVVREFPPARGVGARAAGDDGAIFRHKAWPGRIAIETRAVAVVSDDLRAEGVKPAALGAADRGRTGGVFLAHGGQQAADKGFGRLLDAIAPSQEEGLIADAPRDDARVVSGVAHHLAHQRFRGVGEGGAVFGQVGHGGGVPAGVFGAATAHAPHAAFAPKEHSFAVAGGQEGGVVRIMGAADEVEAGFLHQAHIAGVGGVGDAVAPAGGVLVDIGAKEEEVFAIEEEAALLGEREPAEADLRPGFGTLGNDGERVEMRRLG